MQAGFLYLILAKGGNLHMSEGIILAILGCVVEVAKELNRENKNEEKK